jgi:hypothetical protein
LSHYFKGFNHGHMDQSLNCVEANHVVEQSGSIYGGLEERERERERERENTSRDPLPHLDPTS